jgi:hypothetical protein
MALRQERIALLDFQWRLKIKIKLTFLFCSCPGVKLV